MVLSELSVGLPRQSIRQRPREYGRPAYPNNAAQLKDVTLKFELLKKQLDQQNAAWEAQMEKVDGLEARLRCVLN